MSSTFRYGLYGVGRIGRVHGQIVKDQGHVISAVGDEIRLRPMTHCESWVSPPYRLSMIPSR